MHSSWTACHFCCPKSSEKTNAFFRLGRSPSAKWNKLLVAVIQILNWSSRRWWQRCCAVNETSAQKAIVNRVCLTRLTVWSIALFSKSCVNLQWSFKLKHFFDVRLKVNQTLPLRNFKTFSHEKCSSIDRRHTSSADCLLCANHRTPLSLTAYNRLSWSCRHWQFSIMAIFNSLFRLKKIDKNLPSSGLNRCLNLFHLTALGVGSTLGLGE